jgi:uncharacterized protein (TIGR01777 family)
MDVAVAGSSGFIGTSLCAALASDGHRVVRLVRPSSVADDGDTIAWDPAAGTIHGAELDGFDTVVNLAGAGIGDKRWTPDRKRELLASRTASTSVLANALADLLKPPAVFVTASGTHFYGNRGDEILTEESEPGTGFLAEVCRAWEAAAQPAEEAGVRVVRMRTGVVLGADGGALTQMLRPFKLGLGGRQGSGRQYLSWVSLTDALGVIRRLIDDPAISGAVNVTAPNPVTNAEFTATLGKVLHRPTAIPTPMLALKARYGSELVHELLLDGHRVVPQKLLDAGFEFVYPDLESALRASLATT